VVIRANTGRPGSDPADRCYCTSANPVLACVHGKKRVVRRPESATDYAHRSRIVESCDITSRLVAAYRDRRQRGPAPSKESGSARVEEIGKLVDDVEDELGAYLHPGTRAPRPVALLDSYEVDDRTARRARKSADGMRYISNYLLRIQREAETSGGATVTPLRRPQ
jgi:hypothetical protein